MSKTTESKIECPDCHSMILKTNLAAHKKTKRHQNAVNPVSKDQSIKKKRVNVREPSYSEEESEQDEQDEQDELEDMPFEDEVMNGLEHLNTKLDHILTETLKSNVRYGELVKELNELARQVKEYSQTSSNLLENIRIQVIQEIKACQGARSAGDAGQVQFNSKTG